MSAPTPTPACRDALNAIGHEAPRVAVDCAEVLYGQSTDVAGALAALTGLALRAPAILLPAITAVVGALEDLPRAVAW